MYLILVPLQNTVAPSCRSIEDFEIIEQVGEGHLSVVLHCVDVRSGIHVAVKSYHKDRMNLISSRQVLFPYLDKAGMHAQTSNMFLL
jgi:serine/threonine protein kinase